VKKALEGMRLQSERQNKASTILGQEAAQSPDPFATILGMPTNATSMGLQAQQQGANTLTPNLVSSNYFNQAQMDQAQRQYNLQLQIAKMNPYLGTGAQKV
jgi:hypothetical protein